MRGLAGSVDRVYSVLQERLFDWRYGTDTVAHAELGTLTIEGPHVADGGKYEPTRLRAFRQMMSQFNVPPGSALVDFGCGKGRVLLLAADYAFRRITGVEFAKELCQIARDNLARYRQKTGIQTDIRIVEGDAVDYEIQDDENFFFMFNPFSAALVEKIAQNIARSVAAKQRQVFIIYNGPRWGSVIERQGFALCIDSSAGEWVAYGNTILH
jgi:SAM-dependent methyltransferase